MNIYLQLNACPVAVTFIICTAFTVYSFSSGMEILWNGDRKIQMKTQGRHRRERGKGIQKKVVISLQQVAAPPRRGCFYATNRLIDKATIAEVRKPAWRSAFH